MVTETLQIKSFDGGMVEVDVVDRATCSSTRMGGSFTSGTLLNTTPVVVSLAGCPLPATVWVVPGSGDTLKVEYSMDAAVTYETWPNGSVVARSRDILTSGITHLRFTATTAATATSTYGVC